MNDRDRYMAIGLGSGVAGGLAIYGSYEYANHKVANHNNNDLRSQVQNTCGASLTDGQWMRLLRSEAWQKYRASLPQLGKWEIFKKIFGPLALYYGGVSAAGASLDLLALSFLADTPEEIKDKGLALFVGFAIALGSLGRLWFFRHFARGFVDVNGLSRQDPVCLAAQEISRENTPTLQMSASSGRHVITGFYDSRHQVRRVADAQNASSVPLLPTQSPVFLSTASGYAAFPNSPFIMLACKPLIY